mmetsp:Transcript_19510/g.39486  ORF Transcript_19510/g.39486 Transcript_19510/m.39486 type:complete len:521 (-) Transcript_19510:185-1747(-)
MSSQVKSEGNKNEAGSSSKIEGEKVNKKPGLQGEGSISNEEKRMTSSPVKTTEGKVEGEKSRKRKSRRRNKKKKNSSAQNSEQKKEEEQPPKPEEPKLSEEELQAIQKENEYLILCYKRLRLIRKRMDRISRVEKAVADGQEINVDQKTLLASKGAVGTLLSEVERIHSMIFNQAIEEKLAAKIAAKNEEEQRAKEVAEAKEIAAKAEEEKATSESKEIQTDEETGNEQLINDHVLLALDVAKAASNIQISQTDKSKFSVPEYLKETATEEELKAFLELHSMVENRNNSAETRLEKLKPLLEKSSTVSSAGVTFARLAEIIPLAMNMPTPSITSEPQESKEITFDFMCPSQIHPNSNGVEMTFMNDVDVEIRPAPAKPVNASEAKASKKPDILSENNGNVHPMPAPDKPMDKNTVPKGNVNPPANGNHGGRGNRSRGRGRAGRGRKYVRGSGFHAPGRRPFRYNKGMNGMYPPNQYPMHPVGQGPHPHFNHYHAPISHQQMPPHPQFRAHQQNPPVNHMN